MTISTSMLKRTPSNADSAATDSHDGSRLKKWWPALRRILTVIFFSLVAWLVISHARTIDWQQVREVLTGYSKTTLLTGAGLALMTLVVYSSYDLFGRYYTGHGLSKIKAMTVAFVSYAFNLNFGALVGGVAFRYRMYSRLGVGNGDIARVTGISLTANWLGYLLLAGGVFASGSVTVPGDWDISTIALRWLGVLFVALVIGYLALCQFSPKRSLSLRGHELTLPSVRIALLQLLASSAHWLLMGSVIFAFLHNEIDYFSIVGVLFISAVAGAVTHVPGALGVLEAVFVTMLAGQVGKPQVIAALLAYRAVFYLLPLSIALVVFLSMEVRAKAVSKSS